jgi:hypothetical protein
MKLEEGKITVFVAKKYIQGQSELMIGWKVAKARSEHKRIVLAGLRTSSTTFVQYFLPQFLK